MPAWAAWAAVELARLPVLAQPTVSKPNSMALLIATRDDALLVGVGRVVAGVVLDLRALAAELLGQPVGLLQRREAGVEAGDRLVDRQQVLVPPEALGPAGDRLAGDLAPHGA